eukprot:5737720-Pleurochrysis_carterae.AAC.1
MHAHAHEHARARSSTHEHAQARRNPALQRPNTHAEANARIRAHERVCSCPVIPTCSSLSLMVLRMTSASGPEPN